MQFGMGVLGWPPSEFWSATPYDMWEAMKGWKKVNIVENKGKVINNEESDFLKNWVKEERAKEKIRDQFGG